MKALIVGDVHFSEYSSILRSFGTNYSIRLEKIIESLNWVEETARSENCDSIIYLGDFFDTPDLTANEITALLEVKWTKDIHHYSIVGNHEANTASLRYNSANILKFIGFDIIDTITTINTDNADITFIPYIIESERKSFVDYIPASRGVKRYVFSHNDIKGVQMGMFISTEGFELKEIEDNCDLFINGHLHNGAWVKKGKVRNLGNLTGQNFNEDAKTYPHKVMILDTTLGEAYDIENPKALNFYKLDGNDLSKLKSNSIVTIKVPEKDVEETRKAVNQNKNILESRVIGIPEVHTEEEAKEVILNNVNHLEEFNKFVLNNLGSSQVVLEELERICK